MIGTLKCDVVTHVCIVVVYRLLSGDGLRPKSGSYSTYMISRNFFGENAVGDLVSPKKSGAVLLQRRKSLAPVAGRPYEDADLCEANFWVPEDHIDPRRHALSWHGRSCVSFGTEVEAAVFSSQASDDDAEDPGRVPGEYGAGIAGGQALWHFRAEGLETAQAGPHVIPQQLRTQAADDADARAGRCRSLSPHNPVASA